MQNHSTPTGVTIITGGSRGLGLALVQQALEEGRNVATCSRHSSPQLDALCERYASGQQLVWRQLDITDAAACKQFIRDMARRFDHINALVNNAGQSNGQFISLTTEQMVDELLAVNLHAAIRITRLVAPYMMRDGAGSIVNIGSISGHRGFAGLSVYGASKSALEGFTRCLARELGPRQIRVNTVAPGLLTTDMAEQTPLNEREQIVSLTPMGRLGNVGDVCGLIGFLLSDAARFITGQSIVVDGGFTC